MRGKGFSHDKVDDGEGGGGLTYKRTPILVPDGRFDSMAVLERFQAEASALPKEVRAFVCAKL